MTEAPAINEQFVELLDFVLECEANERELERIWGFDYRVLRDASE